MSMVSTKLSKSSGEREIEPLCLANSSHPALNSSRDNSPESEIIRGHVITALRVKL